MKFEHANELLSSFPIGTKVIFTHKLEEWQKNNQLPQNKNSVVDSNILKNNDFTNIQTNNLMLQKQLINLDLSEILNSSTQGMMIINYFKSNKKLNDSIRTMLVELIINHVITKKLSMSVNLAENIATQVENLFPTEVKVN